MVEKIGDWLELSLWTLGIAPFYYILFFGV